MQDVTRASLKSYYMIFKWVQFVFVVCKKKWDLNKIIVLYCTRNYVYKAGSMAGIHTNDLEVIPKIRRCRNQHAMAIQTPSASSNTYKFNFLSQTIRDSTDLPDCLISSAEVTNDCLVNTIPSFCLSISRLIVYSLYAQKDTETTS